MNNAKVIRDKVIGLLKKEEGFSGLVSVEIDGCKSAAADIAVPKRNGTCDVYRITIVPHNTRKN